MEEVKNNTKLILKALVSPIATLLVVVLVGYAALNVSKAWFSHNTDVDAKGMTVIAEAPASMTIGATSESVINPSTVQTELENQTDATDLYPATHDSTYTNGLKYLVNTENVNSTGAPEGSVEYASCENGEKTYYKDFTLYLGAAFQDVTYSSVEISITTDTPTESDKLFLCSASIDCYVGDTYKGTLCLADTREAVTLVSDAGTFTLDGTPMEVTLRCYFDGAKQDGSGNYYIRNSTIDTSDLRLNVQISVNE